MTPERNEKIIHVINHRQPDLTVVMDNVRKQHNLAAIARTCDAVGITEIHAVTKLDLIDMTDNAACGCGPWVKISKYPTIDDIYGRLREKGFKILATNFSEEAVSFRECDLASPVAIVVGEEVDGITEEAVEKADASIIVPMFGMVQSLNVSVATAVILFEAQRQRKLAGLYDSCRFTGKEFKKKRFEYSYPRIAEYLNENEKPYHNLDDRGELVLD